MKQKISLDKDFLDFIELCNKNEVRYMVIGGYAVGFHGYPRMTKDLDICIEASEENAEKLVVVIDEFGFKSLGFIKDDFVKENFISQIGYDPNRIDIINGMDEIDFDEAWKQKDEIIIQNVPINFVSLEHLIRLKKIAGRPQDIADLHKLLKRKKK